MSKYQFYLKPPRVKAIFIYLGTDVYELNAILEHEFNLSNFTITESKSYGDGTTRSHRAITINYNNIEYNVPNNTYLVVNDVDPDSDMMKTIEFVSKSVFEYHYFSLGE